VAPAESTASTDRLDTGLFTDFARLRRIEVQVAGPHGKRKIQLARPHGTIPLVK
jgi:hypothetical protein